MSGMATGVSTGMKVVIGAAGAGFVGGIVAERVTSGEQIRTSRQAERWQVLHDDFLKRHPAPDGVRLRVSAEPAWKNAAFVGAAGAGVGALGGGLAIAATRMKPQNYPMFVAGLGLAALGGAAALGTAASWAVR